ncbi:MAG: hypothetical protein J6Y80_03975 [Victivallales bacterium]|nr:hypothetical protein [Victivallales bacterium]
MKKLRYIFLVFLMALAMFSVEAKSSSKKKSSTPRPPIPQHKTNVSKDVYNAKEGDDVLDIGSYKFINESKTKELLKDLGTMVDMHNRRIRKSTTNRAPEPKHKSPESIDITNRGMINPKAKHALEEELKQLIQFHNQRIEREKQQNAQPQQPSPSQGQPVPPRGGQPPRR